MTMPKHRDFCKPGVGLPSASWEAEALFLTGGREISHAMERLAEALTVGCNGLY